MPCFVFFAGWTATPVHLTLLTQFTLSLFLLFLQIVNFLFMSSTTTLPFLIFFSLSLGEGRWTGGGSRSRHTLGRKSTPRDIGVPPDWTVGINTLSLSLLSLWTGKRKKTVGKLCYSLCFLLRTGFASSL